MRSHVYSRLEGRSVGVGGQDLLRCNGRCGCHRRVGPTVKSPDCQDKHRLDLEETGSHQGPLSSGLGLAVDGFLWPQ